MFECECMGCFDSKEYAVTFTDMTKADTCQSCLDYLTEQGLVLMSARFINA
jgi:hypothetical protein